MNDKTDIIWKDIMGYEGYYQINNLGEVRSLDRTVIHKNGRRFLYKGKIMNPISGREYEEVRLSKDGKSKFVKVHILVAKHFIPNPLNLHEVNHKNEIKYDNRVENLEWCTKKYNVNYGTRTLRAKNSMTALRGKKCISINLNDGEVREFPSIREAARVLNIHREQIRAVINDNKPDKSAKGYYFELK